MITQTIKGFSSRSLSRINQEGDVACRRKFLIPVIIFLFCACLSSFASVAAIDPDALSVHLQKDCGALNNCTTLETEMITWVNTDRNDKDRHVTVNIGPGTFSMPSTSLFCSNSNNVSYQGAGRGVTVLTGGGNSTIQGNITPNVLVIKDCDNLSFRDMTIRSDSWRLGTATGSTSGISWDGHTTRSHWTNVNVEAGDDGWYDNGGLHYFFGSKITTKTSVSILGSAPYYSSEGGETWFYGGELVTIHDSPNNVFTNTGVFMNGAEIQMFGVSVRALSTSAGTGTVGGFCGLKAIGGGSVHLHGGIVAVRADSMLIDQDVCGIDSTGFGGPGFIHTPGTAFNVAPGGNGMAYRIEPDNSITSSQSPFQWPPRDAPPAISSVSGSDTFVETDCLQNGDCDAGTGTETHLMIYNDSCSSAGPWFDSTRGKCRGAP